MTKQIVGGAGANELAGSPQISDLWGAGVSGVLEEASCQQQEPGAPLSDKALEGSVDALDGETDDIVV